MNALDIINLHYAYKGNWSPIPKKFIQGLNLEVPQGEAFGYLGHNGAGKTTTIKSILGLIRPSKGEIKIFGKSNKDYRIRKEVGYLPEQPYFYDHLKVSELLDMYASILDIPHREVKKEIARVLELVKANFPAKSKLKNLSKGQVQRVGMAQAIMGNPGLLILDEPFSGLDPIGRKDFTDLLVYFKNQGKTIFTSSHILSDVEFLCDRVSIMSKGDLKGVYRIDDLPDILPGKHRLKLKNYEGIKVQIEALADVAKDQDRFLILDFHDSKKAMEALNLAVDSGVTVDDFRFIHGGLEELFIKLVKEK